MRASIRRSASTSASAQSHSIVVVAGRMVRVRPTNLRTKVLCARGASRGAGPPPPGQQVRLALRQGELGPTSAGYARVSKSDGSQSLDLQRDALRAAGVDDAVNLYHDFASGFRDDRPGLDSCLRVLRKGDVLVVWKLDRLGRNLAHLVNTVQDLSARGVGLRVLAGQGAQIDTTTAAGRLVFGIFAALAEFERELIRERTVAGLKAARARGPQGREEVRAVESPRCGWPRPRWRTATRRCPHCAANSASGR